MTVALLVLVALLLAGGVVVVVVAERRHRAASPAERLIAERRAVRIVVTQTDGESFVGLIADWDPGWLLLRECESVQPQGARIGVDGELLLPRDRIAFIQRP